MGTIRRTTTKLAVCNTITIKEAFEKFEKHCKVKGLKDYTIVGYVKDYIFFVSYIKEETPIDKITVDVIEDFIVHVKETTNRSDISINSSLRSLRAFFYFCMERNYMDKFKLKMLKVTETQKEPYSEDELKKLLREPRTNNWSDWRNWCIVNYLVATGNRASTVINIKIQDIDFKHNLIKLTHTKNRKEQLIPLSSSLKDIIKKYLNLWDYAPNDYLFPSDRNEQLTTSSLNTAIRRYNINRNVSKTSIHLFRHTFAKMYILNGGGMMQLQKLLGHSTLDMTRKYVNLYGSDLLIDYDSFNPLNTILKK